MKILILSDRIPPDALGGAEKVAWNFARGLRDLGHDVHILTATNEEPFEKVIDDIPVTYIHAKWRVRLHAYFTLYHPGVARQVAMLYDRIRPDVIGAFNIHNALTYHSLTLAHQRGIPSVVYFQDVMSFAYGKLTHFVTPSFKPVTPESLRLPSLYNLKFARFRYNPVRNIRIRHVFSQHTSALVATSDALKTALNANNIPANRVIYPGIEPSSWQVSPDKVSALRERLGLTNKPVILFAGRLNKFKGSIQVLNALKIVRKTVPDVRLLLLTRSSPSQQGLDQPEFADLLPNIVTGGWLEGESLVAAYHLSDLVTTPSICLDSMSGINLEAMACKKPVVTSYFGGAPEAVIDGETGYVVNPFDTQAFAARLVRILTDPQYTAALGEAGYRRFQEKFTLADRAAEMAACYAEAVEKAR